MAQDRVSDAPVSFRWRMYFYNDIVFSDYDGPPWESPETGLLLVGQFEYVKEKDMLQNGYAYLYRDDLSCWTEVNDEVGLRDQLTLHARHISCVRYGYRDTRDAFDAVQRRARREIDVMRRAAGLME